jgi:antirestriction protein ArdC
MSEIHQKVTNQILDGMANQCAIPWRNAWIGHANAGHPANATDSVPFRGISLILLQLAANARGFWSKWWATQAAWKQIGFSLKPNQRGTEVYLGERDRLRCETMFNAEQCHGADKYLVKDIVICFNQSGTNPPRA